MPRTTSCSAGSPTPDAWLRTRFTCSASRSASATRTRESDPNPVLIPYMASPELIRRSRAARAVAIAVRAGGARRTGRRWRATSTTWWMVSGEPSRTRGLAASGRPWESRCIVGKDT